MIRRRRLGTLFVLGALAMSPTRPAAAQDATFPCKVLLCSQANWPTIPYCVPIMQQAIWMQLLRVAVGICQQAVQQAQQNQSIPAIATGCQCAKWTCKHDLMPERSLSGFSDKRRIYDKFKWHYVRGAHLAGGAGRCRFSMSSIYRWNLRFPF